MSAPCFDTVILSDLHLGSEVSRAQAALAMLQDSCFRRLILLGDIFCDLNFRKNTGSFSLTSASFPISSAVWKWCG
jgi:UDP-2,3-diacylglucosamine pyrophosphatase LpxH